MNAMNIENLEKSYDGKVNALNGISLSIPKGKIFGFLGPNGSGKTTAVRILNGILSPTSGHAEILGIPIGKNNIDIHRLCGVMTESSCCYENLTAEQNLIFFGKMHEIEEKILDERVDYILKRLELLDVKDKKVKSFSTGMKKRIYLAIALIHNPEILFLDEPTSGLDPTNSRIMKDLILHEKKCGKTVLLTTHNMLDAAELCDRVAFIVDGTIKALDTPHNLIMQKGAASVKYTYYDGTEHTGQCSLTKTAEDHLLMSLLKNNAIRSIHSSEPTLNDIFIEVTGRTLK